MHIGLIADTHDHVPHIKKAVQLFKKRRVDLVIHAGDFCSPFTVPPFEGLPLQAVFGNNDGDRYLLMQKFDEIGATMHGGFFEQNLGGCSLGVYHGTNPPITEALRSCGAYDAVISGHTHKKVNKMVDNTLALNPGTAHGFGGTASIALLDTETMEAEFVELN